MPPAPEKIHRGWKNKWREILSAHKGELSGPVLPVILAR